ncbi:hypothetical protein SAMN05421684_0127 [Asanoa ishikariensis]|uniref:Uncharacterized protein n=1 Tax=Asanoa ishikariensis TaxID=137265 RepID=A0A1H3KG83_9ACTN|nr:hypothetical protein SAMN05421684_0127 [Asanoa ishikariensis]
MEAADPLGPWWAGVAPRALTLCRPSIVTGPSRQRPGRVRRPELPRPSAVLGSAPRRWRAQNSIVRAPDARPWIARTPIPPPPCPRSLMPQPPRPLPPCPRPLMPRPLMPRPPPPPPRSLALPTPTPTPISQQPVPHLLMSRSPIVCDLTPTGRAPAERGPRGWPVASAASWTSEAQTWLASAWEPGPLCRMPSSRGDRSRRHQDALATFVRHGRYRRLPARPGPVAPSCLPASCDQTRFRTPARFQGRRIS